MTVSKEKRCVKGVIPSEVEESRFGQHALKKHQIHYTNFRIIAAGLCLLSGVGLVHARDLPRLVCAEPEYHFGALSNTNEVPHEFILANEGEAPLTIYRVKPDCGCTLVRLTDEVIAPGEELALPVRLILKGRSGAQHKRITIESNDPEQPQLILSLIGEAVAEVQLTPERIYWGNLRHDAAEAKIVEIKFHESSAGRITGAGVSFPAKAKASPPLAESAFAVDLETNSPGLAYSVRIRSVPPLKLGQFEAELWLTTDSPRWPRLVVPVQGRVVGDIYAVPDELSLTPRPGNKPLERLLIVQTSLRQPFNILKVEPPQTNMVIQVHPTRNRGYRIELRNIFPEPALDGKELVITTDCATMPELAVPFRLSAPQ